MKSKWISVGLLAALALPAYGQERNRSGSKMPGKSCRKSSMLRTAYRRACWIRLTALPFCHRSRNLPSELVAVMGEE